MSLHLSKCHIVRNHMSRLICACTCFIEFIKRVEEKRLNVRFDKHFISFLQ